MKAYDFSSGITMKFILGVIVTMIVFLPIIITVLIKRKKNFLQKYTSGLALYLSSAHLGIGLLGAVVGYLFTVIGIYVLEWGPDIYFIFIFLSLALTGTYVSICSMLEVIILDFDSLTIVSPMHRVNKISFYELTHIHYYENRESDYMYGKRFLDGYINKKKVFSINESFCGFEILYGLLESTGKIEKSQLKEEFVVAEQKGTIIRNFFGVVFFGGVFAAALILKDEVGTSICVIISGFLLLFIVELIKNLLWKMTVTYSTLYIRGFSGRVCACNIRDITAVIERQHYITLYSEQRKIAKVCKDFNHFVLLQNRLEAEGILFYKYFT